MRLSSFHIDGFGALADVGLERMTSGLVVVLGPNEAGKSTLFDFLSGVLFGFPTRKDNPRYHAPARGGRHGGRVGFVDDAGGTWIVERHAGAQRGLQIRLPDGSEGDEAGLHRALAGASSSLFRAVFAVGLDDLGQMDNLESDEVRELLFSASIFGQRRSATKAMRHLAEVRDGLARPRRDDATANRLAGELEIVRAQLAEARQEATLYASLQRQAQEAEAHMGAMRSQLKALRDREREVQLLETCWRHHCEAGRAREALSRVPEAGGTTALLEHGAELRLLAAEASGHLERSARLADLSRQRASLDASVERRLAGLGPIWTREQALDAPDPDLLAGSVRAARDRLSRVQTAAVSAAAVLAQSEALRALCAAPADPVEREELAGAAVRTDRAIPSERPSTCTELGLWTEALAELRERAVEAERLDLEATAADRERAALALSTPGSARGSVRSAVRVLFVCGLAVAALGAALALRDESMLAGTALAPGGALLVVAGLLSRAERRSRVLLAPERNAASALAGGGGEPAADRAALLTRSRARIDELAELLGLEIPPSRVDIERCASALARAREERRRLDDQAAALAEADARAVLAAEADCAAREALMLEQQAHEAWCAVHGFRVAAPEETLETVAALADVRAQLAAFARVDSAIAELELSVTSFADRCRKLLAFVEPDLVRSVAGGPFRASGPEAVAQDDRIPADEPELALLLAGLVRFLDEATDLEARRSALEHELTTAETALERALGAGEAAGRIRAELGHGDVLQWASERADLEPSIEEFRQAEEEAVRRHQSLTEAMQRIARSDRIAELERRRDALEVELEAALRKYLVLGTARALLQRTLWRHERERQPQVVASAAAHFERVTGGRYAGLLADVAADGKQTLRVLSRTNEAIDAANLSRGTIEQLYLCLRLGLADSFAERSVSLPIVLDDVLVNFDPDRARAVAAELVASARSHQVVFLTCHPHLAEMLLAAGSDASTESQLVELGRVEPASEQASLPLLTALPPLSA